MKDTLSPFPPVDAHRATDWLPETGVLVVGGGGAGICAAIEAAESGTRFINEDVYHGRQHRTNWLILRRHFPCYPEQEGIHA